MSTDRARLLDLLAAYRRHLAHADAQVVAHADDPALAAGWQVVADAWLGHALDAQAELDALGVAAAPQERAS